MLVGVLIWLLGAALVLSPIVVAAWPDRERKKGA